MNDQSTDSIRGAGRPDDFSCPFCAEIIKAGALKCRWCGEYLDGRGIQGRKSFLPPGRQSASNSALTWLFVLFCCALPLALTNPSKGDFSEYFQRETKILSNSSSGNGNFWSALVAFGISQAVDRENFLLFSIHEIDLTIVRAAGRDIPNLKFLAIAGHFFPLSGYQFQSATPEDSSPPKADAGDLEDRKAEAQSATSEIEIKSLDSLSEKPPSTSRWPSGVQHFWDKQKMECLSAGGSFIPPTRLTSAAILGGRRALLVHSSEATCGGVAQFWGRGTLFVFDAPETDNAPLALLTLGYGIREIGDQDALYIVAGGEYCQFENSASSAKAATTFCDIAVRWDAESRNFEPYQKGDLMTPHPLGTFTK